MLTYSIPDLFTHPNQRSLRYGIASRRLNHHRQGIRMLRTAFFLPRRHGVVAFKCQFNDCYRFKERSPLC
jgi:hypothetical protein